MTTEALTKTGSLDANRVGNHLAVLGLVVFWAWFVVYLVAYYVPYGGYDAPGGPSYEFKEKWSEWANQLCPADPDGVAYNVYCVWWYPSFFAFTLAAVAVRRLSLKPHRSWPHLPMGDTDLTLLFFCAFVAPLLVYYGLFLKKKYSPLPSEYDDDAYDEWLLEMLESVANRSGYLGLWPLSFFMIPATKHAPVLALLEWHPFHAMTLHMWCGKLAFLGSCVHLFFYILTYAVRGRYHDYRPAQFIFPPRQCFSVLDTKEIPSDCTKMLAGFFGTLGIFFFAVLMACSIKHMRRHHYMVFYVSHIICAPLFLLCLAMHWPMAHYYLWPSMFYYAAAQTPFIMQHWRNTINSYGVKVNRVMDIPCKTGLTEGGLQEKPEKRSLLQRIFFVETQDWLEETLRKRGPTAKSCEHCVSFDFECTAEGMQQFRPGVYANVFVPDMSIKSHPFTVMHVPGKENECRIVFRVFGKFTDLLARSLLRLVEPGFDQEYLPIPKLMIDGWHGVDTFAEAVNHDKVVLVAAGIGITAHMSLFCELVEMLCFQKDGLFTKQSDVLTCLQTKEVTLHWMCRDENLIRFITDEYFAPFLARASSAHASKEFTLENGPARCRVVIHRTGPLNSKDVHQSSLWKSFVEKDVEGPSAVDYTTLGTYGVPWMPSRFTFGRHETFLGSLPAMLMFLCIFWFSYWFTFRVSVWISSNPFAMKGFMKNLNNGWICVPTLIVAFGFASLGHRLLDWRDNAAFSKANEQRRTLGAEEWTTKFDQLERALCENKNETITDLISSATSEEERGLYEWAAVQHKNKTLELSNMMKLESLEIAWDDKCPLPAKEPEKALPEQPMSTDVGSKYFTLTSKGGRPSGEDMILDCADHCEPGCEFDPVSTAIFLCGPEAMISSVKKATGLSCMVAMESTQNFVKKNKFVFYEEKFEW